MYEKLATSPATAGLDPWAWVSGPSEHGEIDIINRYHQSDHGKLLYQMVRLRKAELMEALFPLKTRHLLQCMSWSELEYSYGLHLKSIINRAGFAYCDNITGYMDSDITGMIIEIGRFFTEIDYSNRPKQFYKGTIPGAVGPFANGPWSKDVQKQYTLNELHGRCHAKGLLEDWQKQKIRRFRFKNMVGIGRSDREAELTYILEIVLLIKGGRTGQTASIGKIGEHECNEFILDFLDKLCSQKAEECLEQADGPVFAAEDLNFKKLQSLGGLSVVWTDRIDNHLRLSPSSRTLQLFWDISLLDQSLLFWSHSERLKKSR